jgi:ATP-dependent Clp protease adaptor protein ClpS
MTQTPRQPTPRRTASPASPAGPATPTLDPAAPAAPDRGISEDFDRDVLLKRLPPHKVIVHNNDFNTFEEVERILMKAVPGITREAAMAYTLEIHNSGAAIPFTGPKERAEAVAAVIRTIGIKVTVEPDA